MITNAERRFLEQWRDQKSGPKWKYYLLFSLGWSVISFLVIFFLLKLLTNLWVNRWPQFYLSLTCNRDNNWSFFYTFYLCYQ